MKTLSTLRAKIAEGAEREEGFTLIELMVVVLIIAILIGIAIPTFLGVRKSAQDRAAQSSLRNTLTNAKAIYADSNSYSNATASELTSREPSITFNAAGTASTGPKVVSVSNTADTFGAAAWSESGKCFLIRDVTSAAGTGNGTFYGSNTTAAQCTGTAAAASSVNGTGW